MYYNLKNIIESLLNSSELTEQYDFYIMNKYKDNSYIVDIKIFNRLIFYHIIKEDSYNLETNEINYVIDFEDYSISKLNKLDFLIKRFEEIEKYVFIENNFKIEYLESLTQLKLKEERKIKLNLLKN